MSDDKIIEVKLENPISWDAWQAVKTCYEQIENNELTAVCIAALDRSGQVLWQSSGSNLQILGLAEYLKIKAQHSVIENVLK